MSFIKKLKNQTITVKVLENQTDFTPYKKISLNRKVNKQHVKALVESFSTFGTASANVIVLQTKAFGQKELIVADGQHSIDAAMELGLPLRIIIVKLVEDTPLKVAQYLAVLNNSNKAWSNQVYLKVFNNESLEVREYKMFADLCKEHKLTTTDMLNIFLGGAGSLQNKEWKSGAMEFRNEADSLKMLKAIVKVKHLLPKLTHVRRAIYPLMRSAKSYDKFANAILKSKVPFTNDETIFYNELVEIYNS